MRVGIIVPQGWTGEFADLDGQAAWRRMTDVADRAEALEIGLGRREESGRSGHGLKYDRCDLVAPALGDDPKRTIENTRGIWIAEIGELQGTQREVERIMESFQLPGDSQTSDHRPANLVIYVVEAMMDPNDLGLQLTREPQQFRQTRALQRAACTYQFEGGRQRGRRRHLAHRHAGEHGSGTTAAAAGALCEQCHQRR